MKVKVKIAFWWDFLKYFHVSLKMNQSGNIPISSYLFKAWKVGIKKHTGLTIVCSLPEKLKAEKWWRKQKRVPTWELAGERTLSSLCPVGCADSTLHLTKSLKPKSAQQQQAHGCYLLAFIFSSRLLSRKNRIEGDNRKKLGGFSDQCCQERSCSLQVCHVSLIQFWHLALFHHHDISKQKCVCFVIQVPIC